MKTSSIFIELGLVGLLAVLSSSNCVAVQSNSETNNPFADIWEQNVFKLRSQPTNSLAQTPPKPPVNIKLTGFEQHGTRPMRVLLAEVPKDPKEQMKFFNLGVGEKEGGVEVLKIHPDQQAVDVVIDGIPEELTVKSNSFLTGLIGKSAAPASVPTPGSAPRRYR